MSDKKELVQKKLTDYYSLTNDNKEQSKKVIITNVFGYNDKTDSWHCLECGDDMGPTNPRQLCGKSYCRNNYY